MQFNYSHDNDGYGYMLGASGINGINQMPPENNIIRFNISENDCRNSDYGALLFENWSASNIDVYNNTFYMSDNRPSTSGVAPALGFRIDDNAPRNPTPPMVNFYNNILFTQTTSPNTSLPVITVETSPNTFPVSNLKFLANDYFPFNVGWPAGINFTDPGMASDDPSLGFESIRGNNRLPVAHTIQEIDYMGIELTPYFKLSSSAPGIIRGDGANLVVLIGANWWAPVMFWENAFISMMLPPQDFFGVMMPTVRSGRFSMGASQGP